jgi:hypothetical protein
MISERLQELYDQYSSPDAHLVPKGNFGCCGVVDEEKYESSSPKLVFVLKEPHNSPTRPNWSVIEFICKQVNIGTSNKYNSHMWKVIGVWSYAIRNNFPDYSEINEFGIALKGLKYIGMTNLKKSAGGAKANSQAVREYAKKTIPLWKLELEIMNPDIILCCGTFRIVTDLLGLVTCQTAIGRRYSFWQHGSGHSLLLSIYHPACWFSKAKLYTLLKEALMELQERGFWHS